MIWGVRHPAIYDNPQTQKEEHLILILSVSQNGVLGSQLSYTLYFNFAVLPAILLRFTILAPV